MSPVNTAQDLLAHGSAVMRCDGCGSMSQQQKHDITNGATGARVGIVVIICMSCSHVTVVSEREQELPVIVYPNQPIGPRPIAAMAPSIAATFNEAREVGSRSPRAAVALLRVALEKAVGGDPGESLYARIGIIAGKRGLRAARIMELLRVVGNDALHGDAIDYNANRDLVVALMDLMNMLVDVMFEDPRVEQIASKLPQSVADRVRFFGDAFPGPP